MLTAKADVIARIEVRTRHRVRPDGSVDALLARFSTGVRALSPGAVDVERALQRALAAIKRRTEAHYFGTDVRAVRLAVVLLTFAGIGVVLYAVLWAVMPAR